MGLTSIVNVSVHLAGQLDPTASVRVSTTPRPGEVTVTLGTVVVNLTDRVAVASVARAWADALPQARAIGLPSTSAAPVRDSVVTGCLVRMTGSHTARLVVTSGAASDRPALRLEFTGLTVTIYDLSVASALVALWRQAADLARALWPDDDASI